MNYMHKTKTIIALLTIAALLCSCSRKEETEYCTDPVCVLSFQPYDDISERDVEKLSSTVKEKVEDIANVSVLEVRILPNKKLDNTLLNDNKTRYSAKKILEKQQSYITKKHEIIIGLTNKDISAPVRGINDWGIQGLSFMGSNVCVVSTYRIAKNVPLWKPIIHEFIHTFWNMPHCPADNPKCLMQDGHGNPKWGIKNDLCQSCKI